MAVDDLGIEVDPEVEKALADPKSGTLKKVFEYFSARKSKQAELDELKKKKEKKESGIFGDIF